MKKSNFKKYMNLYKNNMKTLLILLFIVTISFLTESCSSKSLVMIHPNNNQSYNSEEEQYQYVINNKAMTSNEKLRALKQLEIYNENRSKSQREIERSGRIQEKLSQISMPQKTEDIIVRVLFLPYAQNSNVFNSFKEAFVLVEEGRWIYPDINNNLESKLIESNYSKSSISTPLNNNKSLNYGKASNQTAPKINNRKKDIIEHNRNVYIGSNNSQNEFYTFNKKDGNEKNNFNSPSINKQQKIQRENIPKINNNGNFYFGRKRP